MKGIGGVIHYHDIYQSSDTLPEYPTQEFERLRNTIASRDFDGADECILSLLSYITDSNVPLFLSRSICYDILRTIGDNNRRLGIKENLLESEALRGIASAETVQDVTNMIHQLQENLAAAAGGEQSSSQSILKKIKKYIAEEGLKCEFSIQSLADSIGMLPSNLSFFFKRTQARIFWHM